MSSVSINEMVNRLMFILLSDSISIFCIVFLSRGKLVVLQDPARLMLLL